MDANEREQCFKLTWWLTFFFLFFWLGCVDWGIQADEDHH
jgi:hypothetical protein